MNQNLLEKLIGIVRKRYDNGEPGHDFAHILRVKRTCEKISEALNANLDRLIPASLLHDIVNLPKDHPERSRASEFAANEAERILTELEFSQDAIQTIKAIIVEHSFSKGVKPSSLESAILQDADKLDALGAIGIMRLVASGCRFQSSFFDIEDPFAKRRSLNDRLYMVDHFYTKLFKLPEMLHTDIAKGMAKRRMDLMKAFLEELRHEICEHD